MDKISKTKINTKLNIELSNIYIQILNGENKICYVLPDDENKENNLKINNINLFFKDSNYNIDVNFCRLYENYSFIFLKKQHLIDKENEKIIDLQVSIQNKYQYKGKNYIKII